MAASKLLLSLAVLVVVDAANSTVNRTVTPVATTVTPVASPCGTMGPVAVAPVAPKPMTTVTTTPGVTVTTTPAVTVTTTPMAPCSTVTTTPGITVTTTPAATVTTTPGTTVTTTPMAPCSTVTTTPGVTVTTTPATTVTTTPGATVTTTPKAPCSTVTTTPGITATTTPAATVTTTPPPPTCASFSCKTVAPAGLFYGDVKKTAQVCLNGKCGEKQCCLEDPCHPVVLARTAKAAKPLFPLLSQVTATPAPTGGARMYDAKESMLVQEAAKKDASAMPSWAYPFFGVVAMFSFAAGFAAIRTRRNNRSTRQFQIVEPMDLELSDADEALLE